MPNTTRRDTAATNGPIADAMLDAGAARFPAGFRLTGC